MTKIGKVKTLLVFKIGINVPLATCTYVIEDNVRQSRMEGLLIIWSMPLNQ